MKKPLLKYFSLLAFGTSSCDAYGIVVDRRSTSSGGRRQQRSIWSSTQRKSFAGSSLREIIRNPGNFGTAGYAVQKWHLSERIGSEYEIQVKKDETLVGELATSAADNSTLEDLNGKAQSENENDEKSMEQTIEEEKGKLKEYEVPSVRRVVNFALPAIGVYLCSPLLSMIDTSTVGLFCGTLQQAALNPAVMITDYSARTMSFLYTGTTNMIATSKQKSTAEQVKDSFIGSLRFAFLVGSALAGFLLLASQRMLVPLVGNDAIEAEVLHAAWRYVAIRALGMPAAAMIGTSQAACLGLQDNKTPFRIIVAAAVLNLVLDVALVGRKLAWVGGTAGAAWATTASQYFAMGLFLRKFNSRQGSNFTDHHENLESSSSSTEKTLSTKGLLLGRLNWKNFIAVPCKDTIDTFKPYIIPVTTTQIGRCSTYVAMGHVVSSSMNTISMAAQQIITSIFYALIPIGDSCSLAAQSFLPSIVAQEPNEERTNALNKTMKNIYKVGAALGVFLSFIALSLPLICPLLTTDGNVISIIRQLVPLMFALLSTHGIFCASEGILLAFRDLKFLGRIYAIFFAAVPMFMLRVKFAARAGVRSASLYSVWNVFLGYQSIRIAAFLSRVFMLKKRHARKTQGENN